MEFVVKFKLQRSCLCESLEECELHVLVLVQILLNLRDVEPCIENHCEGLRSVKVKRGPSLTLYVPQRLHCAPAVIRAPGS